MGPLPPAGQWVRLEVPASSVALEGIVINGMSFALYNGRATWDAIGVHVAPANSGPPPPGDTTPPTITITAPANNATVSGTVSVTANASDNVGVAGVQFKLDGANLGPEDTTAPYAVGWDTTTAPDGSHVLTAVARDAAGNQTTSSPVTVTVSNAVASGTVWVEDAIPAGAWTAASGGDSWNWVSANPAPYSGSLAHQSALVAGVHFHFFSDATATLALSATDTLIQYIYLDPAHPPREIMIECFDGSSWSHRAYWGENLIPWGTNGTADQLPMGALPQAGQWVKLSVPASSLNLGGHTLHGMDFVLYDGTATWDHTGK
jgi:hypothetical protein